jgi:hypothetical protein
MRSIGVLLPVVFAFLVGAAPASAWTWPVEGPVMQQFSLGGDPYAAGQHRGIDIGAPAGARVRAPAAGLVSFAGSVPRGGLTVTIRTDDGWAVTLVHLGTVAVDRGEQILEGDVVGVVGPSGEPEQEAPYVHLGARLAADEHGYVDPLTLLPAHSGATSEPADMPQSDAPSIGEADTAPEAEQAPPQAEPQMPMEAEPSAVSPLPAGESAHEAASDLSSPPADEAGEAHQTPHVPLETELPGEAATSDGEAPSVGAVVSAAPQPVAGVVMAADASTEVRGPQARPRTTKPGATHATSKRALRPGSGPPRNAPGTPRAGAPARPQHLNALAGQSVPRSPAARAPSTAQQTGAAGTSAGTDRGFGLGKAVLFAAGLLGAVLLLWRRAGGAGPVSTEDPACGDPGGALEVEAIAGGRGQALPRAVAGSVAASTAGTPAPARAASPLISLDAVDDLARAA